MQIVAHMLQSAFISMSLRSGGLLAVVILALALPQPVRAQDEGPNQAGLVIRFGDGQVSTHCVQFSEPSISGIELLQRAGIPLVVQGSGLGAAVCKIDSEGCDYPAEDCFCERDGATSIYWSYSQLREGTWMYSPLGASSTRVMPNDVEGWAWGSGRSGSGAEPPLLNIGDICPIQPVAVVPTALPPAPTRLPAPTVPLVPTLERAPTALTMPTATLQPTVQPTIIAQVPTVAPSAAATVLAPNQATTPAPSVLPTVAPTVVTTLVPTVVPTSAPAPELQPQPTAIVNYLVFGVMVLALIAGITVAARRRAG